MKFARGIERGIDADRNKCCESSKCSKKDKGKWFPLEVREQHQCWKSNKSWKRDSIEDAHYEHTTQHRGGEDAGAFLVFDYALDQN